MYEMPKRFSQISSPEVVTQTDHIPVANDSPSNPGNIPYILSLKPISSLINPYRPFLVTSIQNNSTVEQSLMKGQGTSGNPIQLDDTYYRYVETATSANYVSDEALVKIGNQKQNLPISVSGFDLILSQDIPITTDKYVNKINAGTYTLSSIGQRMQDGALVSAVFDVTNATFFLYAMFNPANLANNYTLAIFDEPLTAPNHPQLAVVTIFLGVIGTNGTTITSYPTKPFTQFGPYRLSEITNAVLPLTYTIGWYSDAAGTTAITQFNEGGNGYFVMKRTGGVDNLNTYTVKVKQLLNGVTTNATRTITLSGGVGSFNWTTTDNGTGSPNGYVEVDNNQLYIDSLIGNPGKTVTVTGNKTVTIVDADNTAPTYGYGFYSNSNGTGALFNVVEGQTFYLVVLTSNVSDGTVLDVEWSGTVNASADFVTPLDTNLTINSNIGYITIQANEDAIAESTETLIATISRSGVTIGSTGTLDILDMSYTLGWTDQSDNAIDNVNEGVSFELKLVTVNVPTGRVMNLTYGGTATAADFQGTRPSTVAVASGGVTNVTYTALADSLTEGSETFSVDVTDSVNGRSVTSGDLTINDTSITPNPTWSIGLYNDSAGNSPATSPLTPNTTKYVVIKTTDVADGTACRYWMGYTGADSTLHSGITITGNMYSVIQTITDGATALQLEVQTAGGTTLATSSTYSIT